MKNIPLIFEFCGQKVEASFNICDNIKAMPDATKIETILDVLGTLNGNEKLEEFQLSIFKNKLYLLDEILTNITKPDGMYF